MSMLQQIYEDACNSSTWGDPDPEHCGCRGGGWFISQVDTVHKCPRHNDGQPHPEEDDEEEWAAYRAKKDGTPMPKKADIALIEDDLTSDEMKAIWAKDDLPF